MTKSEAEKLQNIIQGSFPHEYAALGEGAVEKIIENAQSKSPRTEERIQGGYAIDIGVLVELIESASIAAVNALALYKVLKSSGKIPESDDLSSEIKSEKITEETAKKIADQIIQEEGGEIVKNDDR